MNVSSKENSFGVKIFNIILILDEKKCYAIESVKKHKQDFSVSVDNSR